MHETRYLQWKEGRRRLPSMRDDTQVYVTKIVATHNAQEIQGVQVDLFRDGHKQRLTFIDEVRWDKFPSEELLTKIALVMG